MFRYWVHCLRFHLHLPPYDRPCDSCGGRAWSWVEKADGRRLCANCHAKEGRP